MSDIRVNLTRRGENHRYDIRDDFCDAADRVLCVHDLLDYFDIPSTTRHISLVVSDAWHIDAYLVTLRWRRRWGDWCVYVDLENGERPHGIGTYRAFRRLLRPDEYRYVSIELPS